jgi:hypothetical protein
MPTSISISTKIDPRVMAAEFDEFRTRMKARTKEILGEQLVLGMGERDLIVTGDATKSFTFEIEEQGNSFTVTASSDDPAVSVLEYGADPAEGGIVDVFEILTWVRKKGIVPDYGSQKSFAFAIAKAIGKEGQPLNGGLKRPFNAIQKKSKRLIEREWEREINRLIVGLNNNGK